jgi:hypothetical protein
MHSSFALTREGLPLGLAAVKFWTRKKFKGTSALKKKINPPRVPIEKKESIHWLENLRQSTELLGDPGRCIHIGDRESDIYELFCTAQEIGTHFLVRTCVDRLGGDGDHTIADEMEEVAVKGLHRIEVRDSRGDLDEAVIEIRYSKGSSSATDRKAAEISGTDANGHPCRRARKAETSQSDRLGIDHRSARSIPQRRHREAAMVRLEGEDRGVPQGPQVGLQSGGIEAQDRAAPDQPGCRLLHPELADLLDDDAQPFGPKCATNSRTGGS